jgi:hypothetical protein
MILRSIRPTPPVRLSNPMRVALFSLVALFSFVVLLPATAWARIDPYTWEELVLKADLVGVVECVTAGGDVARFKVMESWKGPPAGTELNLRTTRDHYWEQFSIALCGERWLVTAFHRPGERIGIRWDIFSLAGPLSWREIPSDYFLPVSQGSVPLPFEKLKAFGETQKDVEGLKAAVRAFLDAPSSRREALLLRGLALKHVFGEDPR